MPNPPQAQNPQYGTMSTQDIADEIIKRRPDLKGTDPDQLVGQLIKAKPQFQNYLKTEDLQRMVNPDAAGQSKGIVESAEDLGKGAIGFFYGMGKNLVTPPQNDQERAVVAQGSSITGLAPAGQIALGYKRTFGDQAQAAQSNADMVRLRAVAGGQDPNAPLNLGQKAEIVGSATQAATSYMGPAGFISPAAGEAVFTPQIAGQGAAQIGQGNTAGGLTTLFGGIAAPKLLSKGIEMAAGQRAAYEGSALQVDPKTTAKATADVQTAQPDVSKPTPGAAPQPVNPTPEAPSQATQGANYRPTYTYKPSEKAAVMSAPDVDRGPEFNAQSFQEEINRNKSILQNTNASPEDIQIARDRLRDAQEGMTRVQAGGPVVPNNVPTPQTPSPVEPAAEATAVSAQPTVEPPVSEAPRSKEAPSGQVAEPETQKSPTPFPVDDFTARMQGIERQQKALADPRIGPEQRARVTASVNQLKQGLGGMVDEWMKSNPDHTAAEQELQRVQGQASDIRNLDRTTQVAKEMRAEMNGGTPAKSSAGGTTIINSLHADIRDVFHKALGDQVEPGFDEIAINQRARLRDAGIDPDSAAPEGYRRLAPEEWQRVKSEAQQKLDNLKNELANKVRDHVKNQLGDPAVSSAVEAGITSGEKLKAKALTDILSEQDATGKSYKDRISELRDIVGRTPEKPFYVRKGKATLDEAGVVRPAGEVGEETLDYWRRVTGKTLRKMPDATEKARIAANFEARGNLLKTIIDKVKNSNESGVVGEARYKPATPQALSGPALAKAAKAAGRETWEVSSEQPAGKKGWLSPDGKTWVDSGYLDHDDIARELLKDVESTYPRKTMLDGGWIRKHNSTDYEVSKLGTRQVDAIEMSTLRDGATGKALTIDYAGPRGPRTLHIDADWTDLGPEIDKLRRNDPGFREASEAGVGGAAVMGGMGIGALTGTAIGAKVAGLPGAIVGGTLGMFAGTGTVALLAHPVVRAVLGSLEDEVRKMGYGAYDGTKQIGKDLSNFLVPTAFTSDSAKDVMFGYKGDIARQNVEAAQLLNTYREHVESLPRAAQIDFIDRYKQGQPQMSPELQELDRTMRAIDQKDYTMLQQYRPTLPFLENHFRVLYETIPGQTEAGFQNFLGKKPLQGSKGMLQQHTFDTLSDAMAEGGVPVTTNPIDMFLLSHGDAQRFVQAQKMWDNAGTEGLKSFVKTGDRVPPSMVRLDDRISQVYFPAQSGEGLVHAGQWYVDEGYGRLLNNYLSPDYIRQSVIGRKIVDFKNATTGWELFGGAHAAFINIAGASANLALGLQRAVNIGLKEGNLGEFTKGMAQAAKSPLDLLTGNRQTFLDGRDVQSLSEAIAKHKLGDPNALQDFFNSDNGQKLFKNYPNADHLLKDAFDGGLNMSQSKEVRSNAYSNMLNNFGNKEYIRGTLRLAPAMLQRMMGPLFDNYIPRMKLGMFMKDMSLQVQQHSADLMNGTMSRTDLARQTVARTENFFGEMNFDNLFWKNTFKTSLQMAYRSVTWRYGTLRLLKDTIVGQAKELGKLKDGQMPGLDPNFGYVIGATLTTAMLGAVIQKSLTGKTANSISDVLHPQVGGEDQHGKPVRVNIPSYASRDFPQIFGSPTGIAKYATGGQSQMVQAALESWNNKNFTGQQISNPNDPGYKQFVDRIGHLIPSAFVSSTIDRLKDSGAFKDHKVLAGAAALTGFSPAPKSIDMSPAELAAQQLMVQHLPGGRSAFDVQKTQARNALAIALRNKDSAKASEVFRQGIKDGTLTPDDAGKAAQNLATPYLNQMLSTQGIKLEDIMHVYKVATPEEKKQLAPLISQKINDLFTMDPSRRGEVEQSLRNAFQAAHAGGQNGQGTTAVR